MVVLFSIILTVSTSTTSHTSEQPSRNQHRQDGVIHTIGNEDSDSPCLPVLFVAMRHVESAGNDRAIGDGGRSKGPYQITRAYWSDACQFGGVRWNYDELVWSRSHSEQVMLWYWQRYGATTHEQRARMHNGGPRGHLKPTTLPYWNKVQAAMKADHSNNGRSIAARSQKG